MSNIIFGLLSIAIGLVIIIYGERLRGRFPHRGGDFHHQMDMARLAEKWTGKQAPEWKGARQGITFIIGGIFIVSGILGILHAF